MLKCFFEGRRKLFRGLYADSMGWDWQLYPVLYLDLNTWDYTEEDGQGNALRWHLDD